MAKKDEDRMKRLAEALRANLRKRKEGGREAPPVSKELQPPSPSAWSTVRGKVTWVTYGVCAPIPQSPFPNTLLNHETSDHLLSLSCV
jgi:hypothetical protein